MTDLARVQELFRLTTPEYPRPRPQSFWDEIWQNITGRPVREELEALRARVRKLEQRRPVSVTKPPIASAPLEVPALKELMSQVEALADKQDHITSCLQDWLKALHGIRSNVDAQNERIAAIVQQLHEAEAALAAMPETWRADLDAKLEALRNTPDALNALLLGAEAFAQSVAQSIEEE